MELGSFKTNYILCQHQLPGKYVSLKENDLRKNINNTCCKHSFLTRNAKKKIHFNNKW